MGPVSRGLATRITDVDVDLIRLGDETGGFVVGYRNRGGPGDESFAAWRAAAARHDRILVITGSRDILPSQDTDLMHIVDVVLGLPRRGCPAHHGITPAGPHSASSGRRCRRR